MTTKAHLSETRIGNLQLVRGESYSPADLIDVGLSGVQRGSGGYGYVGVVNGHHRFDNDGGCGPVWEPVSTPLRRAAAIKNTSQQAWEAAILATYVQKVPVTQIAAEAGVSRQAIYDVVARHRGAS